MWSKPQRGREREERQIFWGFFFTLSAQFPFYFLPEDPCLQNVQSMLSMDRRLWNLPEQKKIGKKWEGDRKRGRERETLLLSLALQYRKMELLPRKPHRFVFFTFYPRVPGTLSYYYNQNTWTAHRLPTLTLRGKKKQTLLVAKCTGLYFCPASRLIGVHVRQPMVDWELRFNCGVEILEKWNKVPKLPPLNIDKHLSCFQLEAVIR